MIYLNRSRMLKQRGIWYGGGGEVGADSPTKGARSAPLQHQKNQQHTFKVEMVKKKAK